MRSLDRKLLRELWQTKTQSLAIGLVLASGVAVLVMSLSTLGFLSETRDAYYDRYRFADLFASVRRAPQPIAQRIESIDGVSRVQTRIVSDVTLDVPDLNEPAVGRLISIPDQGESILNAVHLKFGRMPDPDRPGEVLASDAFAQANRLEIDGTVSAVLNGRSQELQIVGVALSPEYVFEVRGGDLLPDNRRFGVFWMPQRQMESAFDMDGAFNNVTVKLLRGAKPQEVIDRIDDLLEPYGGVGAIDRDQQISARFLADEIKQLQATGLVAPSIFMLVAAFLLNIVLSRRIGTERVVIAALKAFGYSNTEIAWHYIKSSLIVATIGAIAGAIAGNWMGSGLAAMYSEFYRFPTFIYRPDSRVIVLAIVASLAAAIAGSYRAVRQAVKLPPAEAMRPPSPAVYHRSLIEIVGLTPFVPLPVRMILRSLQRRPVNAILSSLGIACSVAVLVLSGFTNDAISHLIDFQFSTAQRQDVQVNFYEPLSPSAQFDLVHQPGVLAVEPFRAVAVNFKHRHRNYRTSILGLGSRRDLYRLLDVDAKPIPLPESGIVLNDQLAKLLDVRLGDTVTIEVLEGKRPKREIAVRGIATEYSGTNAYMSISALNTILRETDATSGAFLAVDSLAENKLYQELKQTPKVASVSVKAAMIGQFQDTIAKNQTMMQSFTVFFAGVIAIGVVYNTARISLDERSRELATMRVIGFTRGEVASILMGELAVLTIVAIPLGWMIGYSFCAAMVQGFESEMYRFPLVIRNSSYAKAAVVTCVASVISGSMVRSRLNQLDLVEVLKSRE
tara:strand:- start:142073 stop:144436 length:2364 start_codon:yes stop_codon:yes gene_type:complete